MQYAAAFFLYFSAFCMIRSFISAYLVNCGFNYTQAGIITGIHMFFTAAIQPAYSQILDRFPKLGLRRFIALCCIPPMACSLLTFVLPAKMLFFIPIYIIFGLCEIGLQSLMVSVGMDYVNAGIPVNAGIGRGFGSLGYAIANVILGNLIVRFGIPISQKLNIALLIVLAAVILTLPDPAKIGTETQTAKGQNEQPSDSIVNFFKTNPVYALFTLAEIFLFFGHSIVNTYMPNVAAQFGKGADFTGAMTGIAAALELIPMMFYSRLSKRIPLLDQMKIAAFFFTVKLLTAALAPNASWIVVSQFMQLFAYAIFGMASIYFTNKAVQPHNRIMAQGIQVGAGEAGFMIGSLVGGIVLDHLNIRTLLWIGVAASAAGSALLWKTISLSEEKNLISG